MFNKYLPMHEVESRTASQFKPRSPIIRGSFLVQNKIIKYETLKFVWKCALELKPFDGSSFSVEWHERMEEANSSWEFKALFCGIWEEWT